MTNPTPIRPDVTPLSLPPYNLEAERCVIGGLMIDATAWDRIVDLINESDFYARANRTIFCAIAQICGNDEKADVLTVADRLRGDDALDDVGGLSELAKLAQEAVTAANIDAWARIVRNHSLLRAVKATAARMDELTRSGADPMQIVDKAQGYLSEISESGVNRQGPVSTTELLAGLVDEMQRRNEAGGGLLGIQTSLPDLDDLTDGLIGGDLWIIAGRPGMGKSVLSLQVALHVAIHQDKPVLYVTLEMPAKLMAYRAISNIGRLDVGDIRRANLTEDQWQTFTAATSKFRQAPIMVDETPSMTINSLRARSRALARRPEGLSLIVVDYLQMMPGEGENRVQQVGYVSRGLKGLAKELNVPVIAVSSLNRSLESRNDKRPIMSDLRESGDVESDADLVLAIYRDDYYNNDSQDKGLAELLIRKNRNGDIGRIGTKFEGNFTAFRSLTEGLPSWNVEPEDRAKKPRNSFRDFG